MWNRLKYALWRLRRRSQRSSRERRAAKARARFWAEVREGEREAEARSRPWADGSMRNASTLSTRKRIDR